MISRLRLTAIFLLAICSAVSVAQGQAGPHIGYVYPAGGQVGTVVEASVGGQNLSGVTGASVSGGGVKVKLISHAPPLSSDQIRDLASRVRSLESQYKRIPEHLRTGGNTYESLVIEQFKNYAKKQGAARMTPRQFLALRERLSDPKRQPNAQIAETVSLNLTIAKDAKPGRREIRLKTSSGVTNPLVLYVGQHAEYVETEPNNKTPGLGADKPLPIIINGQIMPGDIDRFEFTAQKGMRLVAIVRARELIPYLADAVPGWFQASLKLSDASGKEVAYTDDFRFHPDPIINYEVPADGKYVLEIKDSIYRGREDFVYRITVGQLPFITGVFPLGGPAGVKTPIKIAGWNLPRTDMVLEPAKTLQRTVPITLTKDNCTSNPVPFAVDTLPERSEAEPNGKPSPQAITLPQIINGRIDKPGDWDVFSFTGKKGDEIVAEVLARRLESPLDSLLKLTDASGKMLAVNDDYVDKGSGLVTHHADSRVSFKLPSGGKYQVHLGDTQHKGGPAYGYRLRVSIRRPDFDLRVVPSGINAKSGMTVPITVYALRRDDYAGPIALTLKGVPQSFVLGGGDIPAGQDKIRLTLTVSKIPRSEPLNMRLIGTATIGGKEISRQAKPAEDMMQAFLYRHLVPAQDWVVTITGERKDKINFTVLGDGPVKLIPGKPAHVRIGCPRGLAEKGIKLVLDQPPKGVKIKKVLPDQRGLRVEFDVDAKLAKPGEKGNLIAIGTLKYTSTYYSTSKSKRKGKRERKTITRTISFGALPAIPFELVAAKTAEVTKAE
jgi:hypothetical protein